MTHTTQYTGQSPPHLDIVQHLVAGVPVHDVNFFYRHKAVLLELEALEYGAAGTRSLRTSQILHTQ